MQIPPSLSVRAIPDCARDIKIFSKHGMNFPLSCNGNGNYDTIQDINGQYFCVDRDGFAVTDYITLQSVVGFDCSQYLYYQAKPDQWERCTACIPNIGKFTMRPRPHALRTQIRSTSTSTKVNSNQQRIQSNLIAINTTVFVLSIWKCLQSMNLLRL